MGKQKLTTIIIPTYNRSELLKKSISSALNQSYKNIEIIVVDDGSTDNTKETIKDFNSKRIKYYYKKNGGVAAARNLGLKKANGKYIAFLDSDDIYLPNKIQEQTTFLENNTEFGFVYSNFFVKESNSLSLYLNKIYQNTFLELLTNETFVTTQTIMLRKQTVKNVGFFDETLRTCEDYDYWLRAARISKFGYIDMPLAVYNLIPDRLTKQILRVSEDDGMVRLKHLKKSKKIFENDIKKYKNLYNFYLGKDYFLKNKNKQARVYLKKSIRYGPLSIKSYIIYLQTFFKSNFIINAFFILHLKLKKQIRLLRSNLLHNIKIYIKS